MTTGERIRRLRTEKGWTIDQLSDRAGCCPTSISHYENGKTVPHLDKICRIAQALNTTVEALTGEEEYCRDKEIQALKIENANLRAVLHAVLESQNHSSRMVHDALYHTAEKGGKL